MRTSKTLLAAAAACLLVAGCGSDSPEGEGSAPEVGGSTAVSLGVLPLVDLAPIYLGVEQGFFAERGSS